MSGQVIPFTPRAGSHPARAAGAADRHLPRDDRRQPEPTFPDLDLALAVEQERFGTGPEAA